MNPARIPEHLTQAARTLHFDKCQTVFRTGDPVDAVYRVITGEVHLLRHAPDGATIIIHRARRGDFFAEASLFSNHYHCDAVCVQAGQCMRLQADVLRQSLANDPGFALEWIATLSRNLRRQRASQERMALRSTRARIVHYLVDRGEDGVVVRDQPFIRWAEELGVSHEALYRTLASMEKEGILARDGSKLRLLNPSRSL
jgi:CRP/FNR family transcriptional regulator, dissimilatory nitrate respiration regulator